MKLKKEVIVTRFEKNVYNLELSGEQIWAIKLLIEPTSELSRIQNERMTREQSEDIGKLYNLIIDKY